MDYDNDGDLDILSGSYTGEIYYFECQDDGKFLQGKCLVDKDNVDLKAQSYSITVEAWDFDADGDLDLILGTRVSSVELFENIGTREAPIYAAKSKKLKTQGGKPIKGSNAHRADWDGDGVLDLVLGAEYGGVHWYRNVGSTDKPLYGDRQVIVEQPEFKQRTEAEGPEFSGSRSKVFVTDWDKDGMNDLLVGDVQWLNYTLPPLTAEEEAEKMKLQPEYDKLDKVLDELNDEKISYQRKKVEVPEEVNSRYDAAYEAWLPVYRKMSKFDREKSKTHGWVWLYRQIP